MCAQLDGKQPDHSLLRDVCLTPGPPYGFSGWGRPAFSCDCSADYSLFGVLQAIDGHVFLQRLEAMLTSCFCDFLRAVGEPKSIYMAIPPTLYIKLI